MSDLINVARNGPAVDTQHDHRVRKRRRSLRKGTHSCWACKRRKEKCSFDDGDICTGCVRRGTECVSQRFVDNDAAHATAAIATATRLQRIEDKVAQLASQLQSQSQMFTSPVMSSTPGTTPRAMLSDTTRPASKTNLSPSISEAGQGLAVPITASIRLNEPHLLSRALLASLPCAQDIQLLRKASARRPVLSILHITTAYSTIRRDGIQPTDGVLSEPPLVASEPVLIARYMLRIAIFLQDMQPVAYPELACLVESAAVLAERCASTAISLVTRQDDLLGSIESLEGVILESIYQCNSGRLRLSWMAVQRALLLAQTMGLDSAKDTDSSQSRDAVHLLDPYNTRTELPHLWFRIFHYNLQLSRMLGLPPGVHDMTKNKNNDTITPYDVATETPEGYLERVYRHVMILALTQKSSDRGPPDIKMTEALDQELQRASNSVPSHWWLPPNLAESSNNPLDSFWDMRRLIIQMLHQDLRTQLNVPCMLARVETDRYRSDMARIACAHSSREVLSRFMLLRDCNQIQPSCHLVTFLGLMAAITLVLAHLGGSIPRSYSQNHEVTCSQVDSLLSHQAPSDRAMIEQVLKTMRSMSELSGDKLCAQSAHILHRLLEMETKKHNRTSKDSAYVSVHAQSEYQSSNTSSSGPAPEEVECVLIPYFGVMRIMRPNNNDTVRERTVTTAPNTGAVMEPEYCQPQDVAHSTDFLPLDLSDEHWMSQSIDMTLLDAFIEGTI
jgi:hypothetical protein